MIAFTLPGKSIPIIGGLLSPPKIELPPPPPPPPTRDDPAVAARRKEVADAEKRRKGRAASIITGGEGVLGETTVERPAARGGAQLLGQ